MGEESRGNTIWAVRGVQNTVTCGGKQEEEAIAQRLYCQLRIGRGRNRVVLTGEYQGRN